MSKYIIDRFRINKNGHRERVFYTGVGITFNRRIENAKIFTNLERAKQSIKYLQDCNMIVYIVEIKDNNKENIVYSPCAEKILNLSDLP